MNPILDDLTAEQREAVTHISGPLLVVAGPGSGKTRVIARRVAYLIYCGIRPWNILAITFTNKAANEMRDRVNALGSEKGAWLSTFHSYCARVLREFADRVGHTRDFTIYDADDSLKLIQAVMRDMEVPKEITPTSVLAGISASKERFIGPNEYEDASQQWRGAIIGGVYTLYQQRLQAANAMDFDDLLMKTALLLGRDAGVLAKLRQRHQFVLVDEFQDTNRSQYTIARLLTLEHRNICATGDPDQSIYGWRGADIGNILDFQKDYPEARIVYLGRNYRSTKTILEAADRVVDANTQRRQRTLYTENPVGERIRFITCADSTEEARNVALAVQNLQREGFSPKQIAVFYRVNWLSNEIEKAMIEAGQPYQLVGGVAFYARRETKDALAYLKAAANRSDGVSLGRIINVPPRGLGPKAVEELSQWARTRGLGLWDALSSVEAASTLPRKAADGAKALVTLIDRISAAGSHQAAPALAAALEESGYLKMVASGKEARERIENLQELTNEAARYDAEEPDGGLAGFLERISLVADIDGWDQGQEKITLMSVHAAKGLEFPAVLITGLEEGILPHANARSRSDIEEERRVFFVAMTRAMRKLFLFRAEDRLFQGRWQHSLPSRFIKEIPPQLLEAEFPPSAPTRAFAGYGKGGEFSSDLPRTGADATQTDILMPPGTRVLHSEFGSGVVIGVAPQGKWHKVTVKFQHWGQKKLILELARLEVLK